MVSLFHIGTFKFRPQRWRENDFSAAEVDSVSASESSDNGSDRALSRHHLLRHKLALGEETSGDKAAAEKDETVLQIKAMAKTKHGKTFFFLIFSIDNIRS